MKPPAVDGDLPESGLVLNPALPEPHTLDLILLPPGGGQPLRRTSEIVIVRCLFSILRKPSGLPPSQGARPSSRDRSPEGRTHSKKI